ncbi:hypothetical protein AC482_05190 [miscellaneous Crenarchaeota group-15 archaeon DG-45]|uniref:Pyrrolo-quinoline quinone repeat domain-containing protein n=1 Tax=miscellaneous Crenarchaeota group-15 archaeon DG-45 TaxID=1685127 RepID=A0A0M0BNB7_9ARCH|nr:MAG: hypothetical protein AC482_05190 [miscellaneous Crenarchaeota group-15 archaeon DG-45]
MGQLKRFMDWCREQSMIKVHRYRSSNILVLVFFSIVLSSVIATLAWHQAATTLAILTLGTQKTWNSFDLAEDVCSSVNGVYVVGWKFDRSRQETNACLAKFDREGNMIWNATWTDEQGAHGRGVGCSTNGVYVVGTARNASHIDYAYIIKFNDRGEQLWNRTWNRIGDLTTRSVHAIDEAVYLIGDGKLAKLDANGNQLWESTTNGRALDVSSDRIYVAGSTGKGATGGSDAFIAAFDLDGNQLWNTTRESIKGDVASGVCATPEGVYIIGTGTKGYTDLRFITKFDLDGNQLWDKSWKKSLGGTYLDICSYKGYIYTVGAMGNSPTLFDALITQFDAEGNMIWNTTFGKPEREDYAAGVCVDVDGINVVGTTESFTLWADRMAFLLIYNTEK